MDTQFLMCMSCKTIFEVPSRMYYDETMEMRVNQLIEKLDIKYSYQFYNNILPECCSEPDRKWAYGKWEFPEYHEHITREECISHINYSDLKLINLKDEYPKLLLNVLIVNEL